MWDWGWSQEGFENWTGIEIQTGHGTQTVLEPQTGLEAQAECPGSGAQAEGHGLEAQMRYPESVALVVVEVVQLLSCDKQCLALAGDWRI